MRTILTALFALLAPVSGMAQDLPSDAVTHSTLANGLEVVVIEDHRAPVVVHMLWYRAGSADEDPGVSGVAHYLEHLLFKATENAENGEFSRVVAENGGSDNAFTSYDYTAYYQRVAKDKLGLMMHYEADRMKNLLLTEQDAATELQVILEERNQRVENNPRALAQEQHDAAQYLNHRYGLPVIGWMHEMEALTREDARAFYDLYYAPNNAVLVVAGDVSPAEVLALARDTYGAIPAEPNLPERFRSAEPPQRAERRLSFSDPRIAQPYLTRSYLAPERDSGAQTEAAALVYLAELLGGSNFTSVLGQALQFDSQVAIYSGAGYGGGSLDDTTFGLSVVPQPGVTLPEAEAAMDAAIEAFLATGPDPDRIEALRTQFRASEIYARDDVQGMAERYGRALTQGLTVEDVIQWPEILQSVTAEDIMAVATKVLQRHNAVTSYVTPKEAN